MGIRRKFYSELRKDLMRNEEHETISEAFLFDQMLKRRRETEKKIRGSEKYRAQKRPWWKRGDFSQASLEELLELLADSDRKLKLSGANRRWLWTLGGLTPEELEELQKKLEAQEASQSPKKKKAVLTDRARYNLIKTALEGHSDRVSKEELEALRNIVLEATVLQDVNAFLYDGEFSFDSDDPDSESSSDNNKKKREPRKADRTLTMMEEWDSWCREKGLPSMFQQETFGALTDEEREDWEKMYLLLQRMDEPTDVILPVQIDNRTNCRTGIGLYLVGIDCFPQRVQEEMKKKKQNCVFICLGVDDISDYKKIDNLILDFSLTMHPLQGYGDDEDLDNLYYETTLKAGEILFSTICSQLPAYDFFKAHNLMIPKGTPERLLIYFQTEQQKQQEEVNWQELKEEGRQRSKEADESRKGRTFL